MKCLDKELLKFSYSRYKKEGSAYDLPIAILQLYRQCKLKNINDY